MKRQLTIRSKLAWMSVVASSTALALACSAFVFYEQFTFRQSMVRNLSTHAQIVASNSTAAVVFNDAHAANETLTALRAEPHIIAIQIRTAHDQPFAGYLRSGITRAPDLPPLPTNQVTGHRFTADQLVVFQKIFADGSPVGVVYIQSDLLEIRERVLRYVGIALLVLVVSLFLGSLISARIQHRISQPILDLAGRAQKISADGGPTPNLPVSGADEIALLASTFEEMQSRIADRERKLRAAHDDLEKRVEQRTDQLRQEVVERRRLADELRDKNEQLEEQNRRVEQATRLKSEFLANMSHELRTPLNAIIGFTEVMYDGRVGPIAAEHREYLGDILTSSKHLLQLINDVLDLSKVEAGKMEFHVEKVDLSRVIGEVRDILRTLAAKKRIRVEVLLDSSIGEVFVDPSKLKQVLYNYMSNALKFTPDDGTVKVRTVPEGNDAFCIEVEDSGIGIKEEDLGKLFKEFQQLDSTTVKKYQGTGLGLALTRRILEAQGGNYRVRSVVGKGSVFSAILPRVARPVDYSDGDGAGDRSNENVLAGGGIGDDADDGTQTVLVVEDEARDRTWLAQVISDAGYRVQTASTGREAILKARKRKFDAVTLDLLLPDVSGWDVLRAIRHDSLNREVPIIVVTVVSEKGIGTGFAIHDFLVKPLKTAELLESLKRASGERDARPVLVVDDDPKALKLLEIMLSQADYSMIPCTDGESGLAAVEKLHPSAVVLDLMMPHMDGFDFLARLRQSEVGRTIPVIVWTSKDLSTEERARLTKTSQAILLKGQTDSSSLIAELERHLPHVRKSSSSANENQRKQGQVEPGKGS